MPLYPEFLCSAPPALMSGPGSSRVVANEFASGACLGITTAWLIDAFQNGEVWVQGDSRFYSGMATQRAHHVFFDARREVYQTTTQRERFASGQASSWEVLVRNTIASQGPPNNDYDPASIGFVAGVQESIGSSFPFMRSVAQQCRRSCAISWPMTPAELGDIVSRAVTADAGFAINVFGDRVGLRIQSWGHIIGCATWKDGKRRLLDPAEAQFRLETSRGPEPPLGVATHVTRLVGKAERWPCRPRAVCVLVFSSPGEGTKPELALAHPLVREYRQY